MQNFLKEGKTLTLVAPYNVSSGGGMLVGSIFAVATTTALSAATVEPAGKPLPQTNTMRGAQVTATAGAVAAASGVIAQAAPAMPVLSALAETVQQNALGMLIVVGMLVVAGAAYIAWERLNERRKGIS